MPTLEADDIVVCQSNAICRFVARELSLYGANSQEQAIIDQVCETLNDIADELIKIFFLGLDEETKVSIMMFYCYSPCSNRDIKQQQHQLCFINVTEERLYLSDL